MHLPLNSCHQTLLRAAVIALEGELQQRRTHQQEPVVQLDDVMYVLLLAGPTSLLAGLVCTQGCASG